MKPLLPPQLIERLRPELPELCEEIISGICEAIPAYEPLIASGPYREPVHQAVESNVTTFVDHLMAPSLSSPARDELCRDLGRMQAPYDEGMSRLETAIRFGVRLGWRRLTPILIRHQVPANVQSMMADELFGYLDEMIALAREGYHHSRSSQTNTAERRRQLLWRALLDGSDSATLERLADRAEWPLPSTVTVLVARGETLPDSRVLDPDVLHDPSDPRAPLVVPGDLGPERRGMLAAATATGGSLVAGPTLSLTEAPESLRWARQVSGLSESGVIDPGPLIQADDHLLTLWLTAEPRLGSRLVARQLAPLTGLTSGQYQRMTATLTAWLATHGDCQAMATQLSIHPQTVRYRVRRLRHLLGEAMDDPEWRMCTQLTLRISSLGGRLDDDAPDADDTTVALIA
jgi:hypothetical protein